MDKMKDYRQLIRELPSRTIVCAFGEFDPPTTGHELLVKTVNKLAEQRNSDHVIFTSPSKNNSLVEEKKSQYLKLMFPKTKFNVSESKLSSIKSLTERYKNIIVVTGSEHSTDLKKVLKEYTSIEVISIAEKDPDSLDSKMTSYATKGIYEEFKKKLPSTIRELDARRLMNDMRETMGLDSVKEQIVLVKDKLRDDYFRGEVFKVGDIVESAGIRYTIAKRGSNHLLLKESSGALVSKWIHDVQPTEEKEMNEDLTDKTIKPTDKIKVARIIATMLGMDNVESSSSAENLVNSALRKVRSKALNAESLAIINKMLQLAAEVGIEYDNNLVPSKIKEGVVQPNGTSQIDTPVDAPKVIQKIQRKAKAQDKLPIKFTDFTKNIYNKDPEPQADTDKDNESDIDADFDAKQMDKKEIGHTLVSSGGQDNLRRRKINYHLGEQKLVKSFLGRMQDMSDANELSEVSSALLDRYKAGAKKSADDLTAQGKHKKSADRWMGVMKATGKQIDKTTAGIKKALNKEEYEQIFEAIDEALTAIDKGEYDYEGQMARTQLQTTLRNCKDLIDMIKDDDNMPEWVQSKITLAQDYMTTVRDYLQSKQELGEEKTTGATKLVHTRTGADGAKYHIMQDSPTDYSVHREHKGKTTHIDTYGSLHRAKSVLDNEVKEEFDLGEANDIEKAAKESAKAALAAKQAKEKETLANKQTKEREALSEDDLSEAMDPDHPVAKEYKALKQYDIKTLRIMIKGQQKIVDTSEYRSKDHAISAYLRHKHGDKKVATAMGLSEELTESHAELSKHMSDFSKGVKSSSAKQSTYKRDNKPIHNMKHVETGDDHQKVFDHLKKMGYKKTSGYDPKPNEFTMHHNREEMTAKSDSVHHASGISAHIESEHGGKTKVHFTHRNIKEDLDESSAHKIVANKLDTIKRFKDFSTGTLKVPSPAERNAQLKKKSEPENGIDRTQINLPSDPFFKEEADDEEKVLGDLSDKDIDQMIDKLADDEYFEAYEEDELALVDDETGEEIEKHPDEDKISEESLMEVLSRTERIKAKFRLRRTASKRKRSTKIALKRYSSTEVVNKRARRLAIMLMKKRMLRGRNPSQVSVGEKERIERAIEKRKPIINRIASKLVSRVRKVEKARMSHTKFTKGDSGVSF
jgi:hypothetical protein